MWSRQMLIENIYIDNFDDVYKHRKWTVQHIIFAIFDAIRCTIHLKSVWAPQMNEEKNQATDDTKVAHWNRYFVLSVRLLVIRKTERARNERIKKNMAIMRYLLIVAVCTSRRAFVPISTIFNGVCLCCIKHTSN